MVVEKIGILVVKNIKCTLNHNVINHRFAFLHQEKIYLTIQYGNNKKSTKPAQLKKGQDGRKEASYTESITLPVAKVTGEFKITCCDKNDKNGRALGDTRETLTDALNKNGPPDNDVGKGRKFQLELFSNSNEGIIGKVILYIMFLAMEAPEEQMRRVKHKSLRGQMIGIMIIDDIKVKNFNGHKGDLRVMLGNEKASTEKYFNTTNTEYPHGIILPVVASSNFSMLLQVYYSSNEFGNHWIYFSSQAKDLWEKLMNGGQVSVPEISFSTGGILAAMVNLKISIHRSLDLKLLPQPEELKIFHWYLKSAEEGNINGQNKLGYCYLLGIGTTKDDEKAFQWYIKSAEGGNSGGQYSLANCYFYGIGTTKDEKKALYWLKIFI
ncbi:hypothetical protein Glove_184g108 [Diversispora epigaea]|uniref:Uncharacterized protein n=1 Tax=Diversispora epigaea TaxID=1348612 RepID=A0A397IVW4_9GLOM|nr:hypothetical protein Glove_184g108 [Diversispora epigaea]